MKYNKIVRAEFVKRTNRFIAKVLVDGQEETVHVKNTGRLQELFVPGAEVWLETSDNPARKTKYDLVAVRKGNGILFNIDSQACNKVAGEWLATQGYDYIKPEYKFGNSRVDFYMEKAGKKYLLEIKGCTLEVDGVGYFPDAPTERGVKHLEELTEAAKKGYHCAIAFVIQMNGIRRVLPNDETHPEFGQALLRASGAGVKVFHFECRAEADSIRIVGVSYQ